MQVITDRTKNGFTLVEVMVAMLIIFIVLGGVYQTITRESVEMDKEEIILDMQNNARSAMDRIAREIRRSGFLNCGADLATNAIDNSGAVDTLIEDWTTGVNPPGINWDGQFSILDEIISDNGAGMDYLAQPLAFYDNAASAHGLYEEGTDAISLVYLSGDIAVDPASPMSATNDDPIDLAQAGFTKGDILVITDCEKYSIFQKTNCSDVGVVNHSNADACASEDPPLTVRNVDNELGRAYGSGVQARVFKYNISTFFIAREAADADPDLFHNCIYDPANELDCPNGGAIASNIEDLQFEFKFDEDNDNDLSDEEWRGSFTVGATTFTPADVRAIKIWILAMSDNVYSYTNNDTYDYPNSPYYSGANPYGSLNGAGGAPADNRYRYLASSEVYLRNAGL